jgi:hypothetical protein
MASSSFTYYTVLLILVFYYSHDHRDQFSIDEFLSATLQLPRLVPCQSTWNLCLHDHLCASLLQKASSSVFIFPETAIDKAIWAGRGRTHARNLPAMSSETLQRQQLSCEDVNYQSRNSVQD